MKIARLFCFLLLVSAALAADSAPEEQPQPKAAVMIFFGERLADGKIRRTRTIAWKPGDQYGWDVTVFAKAPSVKVKEILTLPAPATFITRKGPGASSPRVENSSEAISADQKEIVKEFVLKTGSPVRYERTYKIIPSDPKGMHRVQIFIDDIAVSDLEFEIN